MYPIVNSKRYPIGMQVKVVLTPECKCLLCGKIAHLNKTIRLVGRIRAYRTGVQHSLTACCGKPEVYDNHTYYVESSTGSGWVSEDEIFELDWDPSIRYPRAE